MKFLFGVLPDTLPPYDRIDKSYRVFNIPHYFPVHHESELILDIKDCAAAIREQRKFVFEKGIPLNYITEVGQVLTIKSIFFRNKIGGGGGGGGEPPVQTCTQAFRR